MLIAKEKQSEIGGSVYKSKKDTAARRNVDLVQRYGRYRSGQLWPIEFSTFGNGNEMSNQQLLK